MTICPGKFDPIELEILLNTMFIIPYNILKKSANSEMSHHRRYTVVCHFLTNVLLRFFNPFSGCKSRKLGGYGKPTIRQLFIVSSFFQIRYKIESSNLVFLIRHIKLNQKLILDYFLNKVPVHKIIIQDPRSKLKMIKLYAKYFSF